MERVNHHVTVWFGLNYPNFNALSANTHIPQQNMQSVGENANLAALSLLPPDSLKTELYRCCGSAGWVEAMIRGLPFSDKNKLFEEATTLWWNLPPTEWHMAFSAHPQIGKDNTTIDYSVTCLGIFR